jgi:hypothetical protein
MGGRRVGGAVEAARECSRIGSRSKSEEDPMACGVNRRAFLAASVSAASGIARPQAGAPAGKPNVVIFLADDLGWRDVGYHDSEIRTLNIDRLASEGVRFERAYSYPVCSPTRSGLMTGRSPMRLDVAYTVIRPWSTYGVPTGERFLPQAFRDKECVERREQSGGTTAACLP